MQVILLAAGQSKRVKPIEDKNFIRFCGKYLIQWQLEAIKEAGFEDVLIVGSGLNLARIENFVQIAKDSAAEGKLLPKNIEFSEQKDLDGGMAAAILDSQKHLKGGGTLIVSSNDVVEMEAYKLILKAVKNNRQAAMIGYQVLEYFPGGYLQVADGFLLNIVEKPGAGNEPSNMINLVIHYYQDSQKLLSYLTKEAKKRGADDVYERAIDQMVKDGLQMRVLPYDGFWQAIKYPWHILSVQNYFFQKLYQRKIKHKSEGPAWISKNAQVAKSAVINGQVIIEEGVKVMDGAIINGPAYIGRGSIIANNAMVRDSVLGHNCVLGFATEIARSNLQDHVWTHSNYVGDSLIGNNVSFGAGTVTGNLRLDEQSIAYNGEDSGQDKLGLVTGDNIRVGINTSLMPGLRIGSNCMIGAGIVVAEDVEEGSFVRGETKLKISKNQKVIGGR